MRGEVVLDDRPCLTCGYNVRSLPTAGKCPECGAPVANSLRGVLLRYSAPDYVARLRRGILLVEVAIGLEILFKIVMVIVKASWGFKTGMVAAARGLPQMGTMYAPVSMNLTLERVSLLTTAALQGLSLVGWWMFTTPDEALAERDPGYHWRRLLRWFLALSAFTTLTNLVLTFVPRIMTEINAATSGWFALPKVTARLALSGLSNIAFLVGFISTMMYMLQLARRIPDARLKKRADLYCWLLPVIFIAGFPICGLGPLAAFVLYVILIDEWRRRLNKLNQSTLEEDLGVERLA
jgi:hypothetical protein